MTNEELWRITKQKPIEIRIKRRKLNWIGHTLLKEAGEIEKTTLDCNPQGHRRRGRPKRTWRRAIEDEIRSTGRSWNEVKGIAGDRNAWMPYAPQGVKGFDDYDDFFFTNNGLILCFTYGIFVLQNITQCVLLFIFFKAKCLLIN